MRPAAILYYFPGRGNRSLGLFGNALGDVPEAMRPRFQSNTKLANTSGPDGGRGLLITWQENVLVTFDRQKQTWRKCGDYWLGVRNDYISEELAKECPPSEGYAVTLGDGRRYVIPVALADAPNFAVPWRETLDPDGRLTREVSPEYAAVCRAADGLWKHISEDGDLDLDEDSLREACANAIAVNYRLDLHDCLALGLFTSETYRAMVRAILDMPGMEELLKKKALAASGIASGDPADSATTAPPTPTSPS